jgi:hypothetical protein
MIGNKLANMRNWSERMSPASFGMSRPHNMGMPGINPHQQKPAVHPGVPPTGPPQPLDAVIHYSFNVPFASDLAGPNTEDIVHATTDAVLRWTHPEEAPDDVPVYELPVHKDNLAMLRAMCKEITQNQLPIEAHVLSATPKSAKGQVTTVCLSGAPTLVHQTRERILNETPINLVGIFLDASAMCDIPLLLTHGFYSAAPLSMSTATCLAISPTVSSSLRRPTLWTRYRNSAVSTSFSSDPSSPLW